MKQILRYLQIFLLFACTFAGCKKNTTLPEEESTPLQKPLPATSGAAVNKIIGAAGGSISSADGTMTIEIPAGAVSGDTQFIVQPVEKNLDQATGTAFRLSPENVVFQKDIKINFKYTEADWVSSGEDYLYLTYQDKDGYFYRQMETTIDKSTKTLSVNTRHFSDWFVERVFLVITNKRTLSASEETDVLLFFSDTFPDGRVKFDKPKITGNSWFVNGPGTIGDKETELESGRLKTTYKAPASVTSAKTVMVGAQIKGMVGKKYPNHAGTSGLVIVQTRVELLPEEYITWEFNGASHTGTSMDAALLGTALNVLGTGSNGAVAISINATKAGEYEIGNNAEEGKSSIMVSQSNQSQVIFQSFYSICNQPGVQYGKGKVVIESFGSIGGFIKGNFSAQVYTPSGCSPSSKLVTGSFKLRRKA